MADDRSSRVRIAERQAKSARVSSCAKIPGKNASRGITTRIECTNQFHEQPARLGALRESLDPKFLFGQGLGIQKTCKLGGALKTDCDPSVPGIFAAGADRFR
jgi:hypothetical protein